MRIDFSPVDRGEKKLADIAGSLSIADLRAATNESIDRLHAYLDDLTDADVIFDPVDPLANDPYAKPGEEHIGWNLAHLIVHVTASSEEGATIAAILARGIPFEGRLRYETPWETVRTVAQCQQRLEESRRIRLASLDVFPDRPFLDVYRVVSERFTARHGQMNAIASFLFGLHHEVGHYAQFADVRAQALAARQAASR
jgi:hypothetical protein